MVTHSNEPQEPQEPRLFFDAIWKKSENLKYGLTWVRLEPVDLVILVFFLLSRLGEAPCGNLIASLLPCLTGVRIQYLPDGKGYGLWIADELCERWSRSTNRTWNPSARRRKAMRHIKPHKARFTSPLRKINNDHWRFLKKGKKRACLACLYRSYFLCALDN